ncbi:chemotaxis response regulator protein-glutamate methylesterase [Simiduia sp. 21SJ11W-1]|uniref:protein-glutamate methylesterase/protein-glutamine glutaminase n=1 Tax=Simiduia sp. 21SJ11W-1 TaxID=2909669 RepID=UPI00209EB4C6|nr:chemotaxis response regulator protein-glutamate methylesterase [Simiduia sp. 21SJ11W-1]UTA49507.1 chemotaxis response regulator protein-glutamate methylesterase [Simiduia sp. 21SJ11W-1]
MTIKVLIVDDSNFFQQRLKEIIGAHAQLTVVGVAANGREAIEKANALKPDVITMDYEMPMMDGVTAVRQIMRDRPTPILMFSSLTYEGARTTLDALEAGAVDFLPKNFSEVSSDSETLKQKLYQKIIAIARPKNQAPVPAVPAAKPQVPLKGRIKLVVIGASTGGPLAITDVLKRLPASFPVPILLVLHMPENFTRAFAERLDKQCEISVKEAATGDVMRPGLALLAPGGKQMILESPAGRSVQIIEGDDRVNYKPCVDITFASAAKVRGDTVLGIVLTGMGSDGKDGAKLLKRAGARVWTQDEASCVIYGMPQAVVREGLSDRVVKLREMSQLMVEEL